MTGADDRRRALRDRLLEAALPHVPFDGWGARALEAGAADRGLGEGEVHAAFPSPARDAAAHFSDWADRRMLERLEGVDLAAMKVRERIAFAVRARLEALAPHAEASRRAAGLLALPGHRGIAARSLYRTVDRIWRAAGDESTDFNFYTKRGLLAAVVVSTTLCWLDDESEGHAATWAFLDRRIADVMRIPRLQARARRAAAGLAAPFRASRRRRRKDRGAAG